MARSRGVVGLVVRAWARAARGVFDAIATSFTSMVGGYAVLDPRRNVIRNAFAQMRSMSANELATMSLSQLRALCRKLERDNATARAAVEGLVAQIVGTGIALEPDHGDDQTNARLRAAWQEYLRTCDVSGRRSIFDLEQQACRELVIAGEFLWRTPVLPERVEQGLIPLVVLPLECEWIASEPTMPVVRDGITAVSGMELDKWGRPVAYRLQNPELSMSQDVERVEASAIIHGFEKRRSLQARGEPWLAPVIERIWQEGDLVDAELRSAITCAAMAIVITSGMHDPVDTTEHGTPTDPAQRVGIGSVARLLPGEDAKAFSHNRPSQQIGQFRNTLRGDIAAACRISQRWLDRDYSRANYSSLRADMLDSERLLAPVREWFGMSTIGALYERVLPYLCVQAGVKMPKRVAYRLVPDGQPYVDPYKDAQAAALAIASGLTTWEAEIGKRGGDWQKTWEQLARERAKAKQLGLTLDLSGTNAPAPDSTVGKQPEAEGGEPLKPAKQEANDA